MIFDYLPFPKLVRIARYDTVATVAAGAVDDEFQELRVTNKNDGSPRTTDKKEAFVELEGCIETAGLLALATGPLGATGRQQRRVVFRKSDLVDLGLVVESSGALRLKTRDRFDAVMDIETGEVIETIADNPGFFATMVEPVGYGPGPRGSNLVVMSFEERARAPRGAGGL